MIVQHHSRKIGIFRFIRYKRVPYSVLIRNDGAIQVSKGLSDNWQKIENCPEGLRKKVAMFIKINKSAHLSHNHETGKYCHVCCDYPAYNK